MRIHAKKHLVYLLIAGTWSAAAHESALAQKAKRPNVVFILVDDMGWTDAACFGSKFYETPNIDRLAKTSTRFTQGYAACPVCSPTRASIMTGKYPVRFHATNFFTGKRSGKLLPALFRNHMPLDEVTLAEALRAAGYATGFFGKWHLGGEGFEPTKQGFQLNVAGNHRGSPPSYFSPYKNPQLKNGPKGEYLTDRLTSEGLKFMEKNKDRPFLMYMSYYTVHIPLQAKKDLIAKYQAKAKKLPEPKIARFVKEGDKKARQVHDHAVYAAMVETLDTNVGRILDKLKELGIDDNTIIIFTSDNGGLTTAEGSPTAVVPLRGGKGWLYEGGIRVPWLIRWPGVADKGGVCHTPVISTDFYPTILEMAKLPLRPKQHLDGVSLTPLLTGKGGIKDRALYWHYPHYSNQGESPGSAIRVGDYVLIERFETGKVQLFDLKRDVGQKHDIGAMKTERSIPMLKMLHAWRNEINANMPRPNPKFKLKLKKK